ncbi:nucleoside/nucleotide kinase family protein [Georgenia sp. Z1491]|uniref:nucleoside/nucleotide kinase family protein n=1 Tax=Georgenia sp. Z1491 TaxID=3416707 RepID=UPI003CEC48E5
MSDALVESAARLAREGQARSGRRPILGITGAPGAGKSTLAASLAEGLRAGGVVVGILPMDGFHLADVELDRLGRRARKGAIDTFDGWGYLSVLERVAAAPDHIVYAPGFERELEQPIAGAVAIEPDVDLVITEGNYLLADDAPWDALRGVLGETWFVEVPDALRRERLVARHVTFGKSEQQARDWVRDVDEPNARAIQATRDAADRVVEVG